MTDNIKGALTRAKKQLEDGWRPSIEDTRVLVDLAERSAPLMREGFASYNEHLHTADCMNCRSYAWLADFELANKPEEAKAQATSEPCGQSINGWTRCVLPSGHKNKCSWVEVQP